MRNGSPAVVATQRPTDAQVEAAARTWADATARRDGAPAPAPWRDKLPGVRRRLALPGATLFLVGGPDEPAGFALAAPAGGGAELFYLAVAPGAWGTGVASRLLGAVTDWASSLGHDRLVLWVIEDNERAQDVYRRAGWSATDDLRQSPPGGRTERRFVSEVGQR
ncbi:MAG: GNAT family N-acetyltransferase [Nocardioides sp.]